MVSHVKAKDYEARGYLKENANDNGHKRHPKTFAFKKQKHYRNVPDRIKKEDEEIVFLASKAKNKGLVNEIKKLK